MENTHLSDSDVEITDLGQSGRLHKQRFRLSLLAITGVLFIIFLRVSAPDPSALLIQALPTPTQNVRLTTPPSYIFLSPSSVSGCSGILQQGRNVMPLTATHKSPGIAHITAPPSYVSPVHDRVLPPSC
jgi:hypothetical protein